MSVLKKFHTFMSEVDAALIERYEEIRMLCIGLVAREHVLLVGPPGTAKSMVLDVGARWAGAAKFDWLMSKFTTPEDLFGPISVKGLKDDRYVRITRGKAAEADFVFIDEVFRSSSAALNLLLKLMNERTYDAGDGPKKTPLRIMVGAANRWPGEDAQELGALFDRFLLRRTVKPVSTLAGQERLLFGGPIEVTLSETVTAKELDQATYEASGLKFSADGREAMWEIIRGLAREGIVPGDRRRVKAVKVAQAAAWLAGAAAIEPDHLEVLADCLWDDPTEQPAKCAQVIAKIANPVGMLVNGCLVEAEAIVASCNPRELDQAMTAVAKLEEIEERLKGKSEPRAETARKHVVKLCRDLRAKAMSY